MLNAAEDDDGASCSAPLVLPSLCPFLPPLTQLPRQAVTMGFDSVKSRMHLPMWLLWTIATFSALLSWVFGTSLKINYFNVRMLTMHRCARAASSHITEILPTRLAQCHRPHSPRPLPSPPFTAHASPCFSTLPSCFPAASFIVSRPAGSAYLRLRGSCCTRPSSASGRAGPIRSCGSASFGCRRFARERDASRTSRL